MAKQRRTKGDGALFQRADGVWIGRVELPVGADGKRRTKTVSSRNRNTALTKLKKLRAEVDAGHLPLTSQTTVGRWMDRWLNEIHAPRLRPSTLRSYESTIRLHINPHIGHIRIDKLTPAHVRQMHTAIESEKMAHLSHAVLQRALDDAVREGILARNVTLVVHRPKYLPSQREPLTTEQAKQLLRSAIDNEDPMATRWAAALLLGARRGEILGLQWARTDLDAGVVDFAWQLQDLQQAHGCGPRNTDGTWPCGRQRVGYCPGRHWDLPRGFEHKIVHRSVVLTRPKTKAGTRIVPIPAPLWAMLKQQPRGGDNPHDLVWHHSDGRPIHPRDDYANWQAALATAGLPPAPLHVARHTTATLLLQAGVPEEIRMAVLGHVSATAHRAYAHIDQSVKRQAMTALDALLS